MPTNALNAHLRIICHNPPAHDGFNTFGLQDKTLTLHPGEMRDDGALLFICELSAKPADGDLVNFTGAFAHGTPTERFLYLSLGQLIGGNWRWQRRLKIPLKTIRWAQVEAGGILEAQVDGRGAATVKLLGDGWVNQPT